MFERMMTTFVVLVLMLAAPALADGRAVEASQDPGVQGLAHVFRIHSLPDDAHGVAVRLFESGGGDPMMNGNRLLLAIVPDPEQAPRVWETGLDVFTVERIELDVENSEIGIHVTEHVQGADGIRIAPALYRVRYAIDPESGAVSKTIRVIGIEAQ